MRLVIDHQIDANRLWASYAMTWVIYAMTWVIYGMPRGLVIDHPIDTQPVAPKAHGFK